MDGNPAEWCCLIPIAPGIVLTRPAAVVVPETQARRQQNEGPERLQRRGLINAVWRHPMIIPFDRTPRQPEPIAPIKRAA